MERVLSSRTFRSGRVAKMTYSETDEPDATHQHHIPYTTPTINPPRLDMSVATTRVQVSITVPVHRPSGESQTLRGLQPGMKLREDCRLEQFGESV